MNERLNRLEEDMKTVKAELNTHLKESGYIQSNLKWNTWLTCATFAVIIGKLVSDFMRH